MALITDPLVFSQAISPAAQPDITGQPVVLNLPLYDSFLHNLGEEDDRIQKAPPEGTEHTKGRRDYSAAIGIGKSEEQMMLTAVLDGYHREKEKDDQLWEDEKRLTHEVDNPEQGNKTYYQEKETIRKEKYFILRETRTKLNEQLGEETFKKLDTYVNSKAWSTEVPIPGFGQISEPAVKLPGWSHLAYPGAYGDFFEGIGRVEVNNRGAIENGRETMPYTLPIGPLPEDGIAN
jgi:hypothetical protein